MSVKYSNTIETVVENSFVGLSETVQNIFKRFILGLTKEWQLDIIFNHFIVSVEACYDEDATESSGYGEFEIILSGESESFIIDQTGRCNFKDCYFEIDPEGIEDCLKELSKNETENNEKLTSAMRTFRNDIVTHRNIVLYYS